MQMAQLPDSLLYVTSLQKLLLPSVQLSGQSPACFYGRKYGAGFSLG